MRTALSGFPAGNYPPPRRLLPGALVITAAFLTVYTAAVFVFGQIIGARDTKLLHSHDTARITMIARACGNHGALWQRPGSDEYACVYLSRGEAPIFEPVPAAVLLAGWR